MLNYYRNQHIYKQNNLVSPIHSAVIKSMTMYNTCFNGTSAQQYKYQAAKEYVVSC